MARVTSTAMRTQHLLDDERAAREERDRQATENARLLAELTQRQVRLAELANEQAALRRVAVLVAGGAPPPARRCSAAAVAEEVGRLLEFDFATLVRYDPQDAITIVGTWTRTGAPSPIPVGNRLPLGGRNLTTVVYQTAGRRGSTTTTSRAQSVTPPPATGGSARRRAYRSGSRGGCGGAACLWRLPARSRCRRTLSAAGRVHRAGRDRDRQRAGAYRAAQVRRGAGGAAPGGDPCRRQGTPPEEVFAAVAEEVGRLLGTVQTNMLRYDPDDRDDRRGVRQGRRRHGRLRRRPVQDRRAERDHAGVRNRPARIDGYSGAWGAVGRAAGYRSSVGVPNSVEGRLWASSAWRQRATSRCRRTSRPGWPGLPSWSRPRSPTRRRA